MFLVDYQIREYFEAGNIEPQPDWGEQLQPSSLDLKLSNEFMCYCDCADEMIDPYSPPTDVTEFTADHLMIEPGEFYLASTEEYVKLDACHTGLLQGRSSFARFGLTIHVTAGYIDPGFEGKITLELANLGSRPIYLEPGMRIAQLSLIKHNQCSNPYNGKYQNQIGVKESKGCR